jgi:hypothetical protein
MFMEVRDNSGKRAAYKSSARTLACPANRLIYWISEREKIRMKKEKGAEKPWTHDPILDVFKFCNVRREDDRVTKWIKDNWRDPNRDDPNMWFAMGVARMINWPPTLKTIGYPHRWEPEKVRRKMSDMRSKGEKVFTGAYMITNAGQRMSKVDTVVFMLDNLHKQPRHPYPSDSLAHAHKALMSGDHNGMGNFMAGQVIADCKHTTLLNDASDWWDWCAPGPGSQRGLSRLLGYGNNFQHFRGDDFIEMLKQLRKEIHREINIRLCLQDMQSCLCEFDKMERALWGEGRPRSKYTPTKEF